MLFSRFLLCHGLCIVMNGATSRYILTNILICQGLCVCDYDEETEPRKFGLFSTCCVFKNVFKKSSGTNIILVKNTKTYSNFFKIRLILIKNTYIKK